MCLPCSLQFYAKVQGSAVMSPNYCLWDLAASLHPQLQSFRMHMLRASKQGTEARHCPGRALAGEQAPPTASSTFTFQFLALGFFFPKTNRKLPISNQTDSLGSNSLFQSVILPAQGLFSGGGRGAALVFLVLFCFLLLKHLFCV